MTTLHSSVLPGTANKKPYASAGSTSLQPVPRACIDGSPHAVRFQKFAAQSKSLQPHAATTTANSSYESLSSLVLF